MIAQALRLALNLAEGRLLQVELARSEIRKLAEVAAEVADARTSTMMARATRIIAQRDEALGRLDEVETAIVDSKKRLSEIVAKMADQRLAELPTFDETECRALRLLVEEMGADDGLGRYFGPEVHRSLVAKLAGVPRG